MSILYIIWKFPLSILIAIECTFIGLVFTLIALITGSIWGNPTWGTWWIWDARLTSFLILVFIYLGLIVLSKSWLMWFDFLFSRMFFTSKSAV